MATWMRGGKVLSQVSGSTYEAFPRTGDGRVEIDTGTALQYASFKVKFAIAAGSMQPGDAVGFRIRRIASTAEIAGEFAV